MGRYNPHSPYILGQEYVPIQDVDLQYSPGINSVERGVAYQQASAGRIRDARFYLNEMQPTNQDFQIALVNLYPYGLEDQTGPIEEVLIPVASGEITSSSGNTDLLLAPNMQTALYQPGDTKGVRSYYVTGGLVGTEAMRAFFNVAAYPQLNGKRILNLSLVYSGYASAIDAEGNPTPFVSPNPSTPTTVLSIRNNGGTSYTYGSAVANSLSNMGALAGLANTTNNAADSSRFAQEISVVDLGDINHWWQTAAPDVYNKMPWRYTELMRFDPNDANRYGIYVRFQLQTTPTAVGGSTPALTIEYMALRVIYCEEKRIAYGARQFIYNYGANIIPLRDLTLAADPVVPAGTYLPTLSWVSPGQVDYGQAQVGDFPKINATRELYQIPTHPAVDVNVPFPLAERIGDVFTSTVSHILPQVSLHASGGTLLEPHVYGRQLAAEVYGSVTATQDIYDDTVGAATTYQQVRYYARRFGDTTVPLTLTGVGSLSGSSVSITVAEFDALQKIMDGWAEVTLRFASPPTMGDIIGLPAWTWSAAGETAGNRWEILGASAPAISGVAGSLHTLVPSPNQLGAATYEPNSFGMSLPGVSGSYASTPDNAALDIVGDITLEADIGPNDWTPSATMALVSKWAGAGQRSYLMNLTTAGNITMTWSTDGTAVTTRTSTVAVTPPASGRLAVRARLDVNDGAGNHVVVFETAPTINGPWTQLGAAVTTVGVTSIFSGTLPVEVGSHTGGTASPFSGIIYAAKVINSAGTEVANPDFASQPPGTTSFTDQAGRVWTLNGSASIVQGTQAELTWMPQGVSSPYVSGAVPASADDAVLIFSQDPPLVTGVALSAQTQVVTGIGLDCGSLPCCIPSGIAYQRITWATTSLPATGFGAYELQRFDYLDPTGDFQTIMLATSPAVTGFNDFEARVGITSVYRIRALNALNFAGLWSTYVSGAPPAPGVTGGCTDATGALIFTSNADQSGASNAAYVMQWEGSPDEAFSLPEADMVQFQPVYQRDGSIAFHGTERGLETFTRNLLLHAGAIDPVRLADAKTLRDLAWANLPYVCVRDDIGDRWLANVRVPTVNVRANRTKYMGRVEITETTTTPYPVDP